MKFMTGHESEGKLCFIDSNIWLYAFIASQAPDKSIAARSVIKNNDTERRQFMGRVVDHRNKIEETIHRVSLIEKWAVDILCCSE